MPSDARMRASDADREHVVSLLQEHHAVGRLTAEEFGERLERALGARTLGELDELLADLPHTDLRRYTLPDAALHRPEAQGLLPAAGIKPWSRRLYPPRTGTLSRRPQRCRGPYASVDPASR